MAVQFDPIAKDESLNTTEQATRNIADVLAQELSGIATAISGGSDKAPKTDIATVEPTNVASRAYSVGELVYVSGSLYKVKKAIASGATFTVGTNIQSTNVSNAIEDALTPTDFFSNITTPSGITLRGGYAKIINGVKYIYLRFEISSGFTSRTLIGYMPTEGRPSTVIRMTATCASTYDYPLNMVANVFLAPDSSIYAGDYISPSGTPIKEVNIIATYI